MRLFEWNLKKEFDVCLLKGAWWIKPHGLLQVPALKLIICYISGGATNIAEVSSRFHQADWSTTLGIVYCIQSVFCFGLFVYLFTGT